MVKRTQTIRRLLPTNCLSVFDHFVGVALKGSTKIKPSRFYMTQSAFICSKLTMETLEQGVKHVQSFWCRYCLL